jgi:phospholipid/cholesterol/gamma-HCH transport system substrate-binding protein
MRVRGALSFVAFALMIVFALEYFTSMGVRLGPPVQSTVISMEVSDIHSLVAGSTVQLRGVPIGKVNGITTTIAGATVNFAIDSRYKIPVNSDVRLENLSALGEGYIELVPRSEVGPVLQDGQRIATSAVTNPPSISELATSIARVLNQLDPAALERIVNETHAALPSPATVLPNLSRTATLLRNTAATMNGKGRELLDNFQGLFRNADFVGPVLAFNAPYLSKIGRDVKTLFSCALEGVDQGAPQTMHNFGHFMGRLEHLLDHSGGDLKVLTQAMLPYLNDTSGALMNLDTAQVFENMLAAVPADGAVTLHVTIPVAGAVEDPAASAPATAAAPPPQNPAAGADTAEPTAAPPAPVPFVSHCKFAYPTPTTPAAAPSGN